MSLYQIQFNAISFLFCLFFHACFGSIEASSTAFAMVLRGQCVANIDFLPFNLAVVLVFSSSLRLSPLCISGSTLLAQIYLVQFPRSAVSCLSHSSMAVCLQFMSSTQVTPIGFLAPLPTLFLWYCEVKREPIWTVFPSTFLLKLTIVCSLERFGCPPGGTHVYIVFLRP